MPRILLQGDAHYSFTTEIYLQVDCQVVAGNRELVVYVKEYSQIAPAGISLTGNNAVEYVVDGKKSPSRKWDWQLDGDLEFWYAPPSVVSNIIRELTSDPREFIVIIKPGEEYENTHTFDPRGFSEASKPVLRACR